MNDVDITITGTARLVLTPKRTENTRETGGAFYEAADLEISVVNTQYSELEHLCYFSVTGGGAAPTIEVIEKELRSELLSKCEYIALNDETLVAAANKIMEFLTGELGSLSDKPLSDSKKRTYINAAINKLLE